MLTVSIQTAISYDIVISGTSVTTTQLYLHADADDVVAATRGAWIDDGLRVVA